ncbi:DinB family protein [Hymenobacter gummosus]|uniref:DinB family protein n=1 Tax=Hymenobacter gummosus TaxID=1776032 RepID=A0A431U5D5_9BACT|nr:DinB family protein [Hymenobacter gummosus]RTQ51524.1 DinB family protein [Hymenobacter gummosus]
METPDLTIRPEPGSYPAYFDTYIGRIGAELSPLDVLAVQPTALHQLLAAVGEEQATLRYAPGKWSIKQVVLHLADAERVFAFRALSFARGEAQSLPGFDENSYADLSGADDRTLRSLLDEYAAVRQATLALFSHLTAEQLDRPGTANNRPATARALLFITAGHEAHHLAVLAERYLPLLTLEA